MAAPPAPGAPPEGAPPAYHHPGQQPPPYSRQGYGPGWPQPGHPEPGNGSAVAALVLGIVALALLLVTAGFSTIISLGCAIAAIPLGRKGRRLVDEGRTRKHRGLAQAGFIMGVVGTVLSVLATLFWVLIVVLSEDFQQGFDEGFDEGLDGGFDQSLEPSSFGMLALRVAVPLARGIAG